MDLLYILIKLKTQTLDAWPVKLQSTSISCSRQFHVHGDFTATIDYRRSAMMLWIHSGHSPRVASFSFCACQVREVILEFPECFSEMRMGVSFSAR